MNNRRSPISVSWKIALLTLPLILFGVCPAAYATLERVGPVDPANGGYPAWYQDTTGLALDFCGPLTQAELNDGWCVILPPDIPTGAVPEVPFTNYSPEHFYWLASSGNRTDGLLTLALEAAFNTADPTAGEQVVFGRLRITIPTLPLSGDYQVYTPYGDFFFPGLTAGNRLFFTSDIGIACGTGFGCALSSAVGPYLLPSPTPGGAEMPPVSATNPTPDTDPAHFGGAAPTPYPGTGKMYIADPARLGPVTGSTLAPFTSAVDAVTYDHNRFRVEVNGTTVLLDDVNFALAGRVMDGAIPSRVTVDRASYAAAPGLPNKLDVFATAFPATQSRVPAGALPPSINPDLGFYDAPCATDPVTGAVTGPPAGAGFLYYQMLRSGDHWWGQNAPAVIPTQVCVQDLNARDSAGNAMPAYFLGGVTDEVDVFTRDWDPTTGGGTLRVIATSSDRVSAPTLTVAGLGVIDPVTDSLTVSSLPAPPAKVTVVSARGGTAEVEVRTGVGIPVIADIPVANADSVTTLEDTTAANIDVLANDTLNGGAIPAGSTVVVTMTAQGLLGTATVNLDNTITYVPNLNVSGTDIVGYKVTVDGGTPSNEGYLTVIITPVNDAPVAVDDATGAPNNRSVTIGVLANDTDPDGQADLANAVIATLPAAGATLTCNGGVGASIGTVCADGLVTFTPTVQGTFTFTYWAQDLAGALSATAATVTVTVNATENIVISKTQYEVAKNRWRVTGTDSLIAGQTLTIAYTGGTYRVSGACTGDATGAVIGSAPMDAAGNWAFDAILTSAGLLNPTNTGGNSTGFWCTTPRALSVTSPLGGTSTSNISLK